MVRIYTSTLTELHWAAVALTAITGLVHFAIAPPALPGTLGISFVLAGLGFFTGIAMLLFGFDRRRLYLIGIPYTAVQIPLWWYFNDVTLATFTSPGIGVVDKVVQIALIVLLAELYRRES